MSMDGIIPYVLGGGGGGGGSSAATVAAMISGTEDTATASQGYSVGEYFIYNDALYIVTSPISQGDTITPGTNCDTTTVCENLTDLNGALNKAVREVTDTALTSSDDLDNYRNNGLWRIGGSAPQHAPSGIHTWIVFMVSGVGTTRLQTIFDTSGTELTIYQRSGGADYWNAWQKISSADISTISSAVGTLQTKVSTLESAVSRNVATPSIVGTKFSLVSYDTTVEDDFCFGSITIKCESNFDADTDSDTNYIQMPFTRAAYSFQPVFVRSSQWDRSVVSTAMAYCPTNGKIGLPTCTTGQYLTIVLAMPVIYS